MFETEVDVDVADWNDPPIHLYVHSYIDVLRELGGGGGGGYTSKPVHPSWKMCRMYRSFRQPIGYSTASRKPSFSEREGFEYS